MNLLLSIPSSFLSEILIQWIEVKDISKLDSAICNKSQRYEWLQSLSNDSIVLPTIQNNFQWLVKRKVHVSEFVVVESTQYSNGDVENFIDYNWKQVKVVKILCSELLQQQMDMILSKGSFVFRNIERLVLSNSELEPCIRCALSNCPKLHTLVLLRFRSKFTGSGLHEIRSSSLTHLRMEFCNEEAALLAITNSCRNLTSLVISYGSINDETFAAALRNCVKLAEVELDSIRSITDATITAIARKCPNLASISVKNCSSLTRQSV